MMNVHRGSKASYFNGGKLSHYNRMFHTNQSQILMLEGSIRVDICQHDRLIVNRVEISIKMIKKENCFRSTADRNKQYKLNIEDAVLKTRRLRLSQKFSLHRMKS